MATPTPTPTPTPPPHIAILPTPGMGHLIPLFQFAKKLHHTHHITSTFLIPTDAGAPPSSAVAAFLSSLPPSITYVLLPPVDLTEKKDAKIESLISLTITRSLPSIRDAVKSLQKTKKISAFVVDLFGTDGFDVAIELDIPRYIFFPSNATGLALFLHLPKLDETVSCEYRDVHGELQIPGSIPIHGKDLLDPVQERNDDAYKWVLHHAKRYGLAEGIMVNSFKELEPWAVEYLLKKENGIPTVYPIGPLVQMGSTKTEESSIKWLDEQPISSVLYVSFGSGGTLSHDQIIELASGLELSEQRFLWVIRCPNDKTANADFFTIHNSDDPLAYLPKGFLDRTRGRGLVVPMWAPQAQILANEAVGAFLTHCGWNSTLESVVNGVPLIVWPLYAEQKMNAVMLHEHVRVALRPKAGENGLVGRVEIANVVKSLMEGEEGKGIRGRMRELKDCSTKVLSKDGSSSRFLDELANKWKSNGYM